MNLEVVAGDAAVVTLTRKGWMLWTDWRRMCWGGVLVLWVVVGV
jgi:hypothetical protein